MREPVIRHLYKGNHYLNRFAGRTDNSEEIRRRHEAELGSRALLEALLRFEATLR